MKKPISNRRKNFINILIIILLSFFVIQIFNGCDTCGSPNNPDSESKIYFTAIPLNDDMPSIFGISENGDNIREIIKNGVLYSAPSVDNKIIFWRRKSAGNEVLFRYDLTNGNLIQIVADNYYQRVDNPILSADGRYVAFYIGSNKLMLYDSKSLIQKEATSNFCEGTLPAFSPDGKYLAFYEGLTLNGPCTVKVVNTDDPKVIKFERAFTDGVEKWKGDAAIEITKDGYLIYSITKTDISADVIFMDSIESNSGNSREFPMINIGAYCPTLSPYGDTIAFAARDGDIRTTHINDFPSYFRLTHVDSAFEYCLYPQWSSDGKKVLYSKYYKENDNLFDGILELYDDVRKRNVVISHRVYRGFWSRVLE